MDFQIIEKEGKFGCKDNNGRWVLMSEYDKMKLSNNCIICWKNDKIQVYNLDTKAFLLECETIREDKNGYWAFCNGGKWGVLSTFDSGKIIINNVDDVKQLTGHLYSIYHDGYYEIANSRDCYARHFDGHPIFYNYYRILAKKGDKYGFINDNNLSTIPFIYDEIKERYEEGLFDVRIGKAWGILSLDGREIVQVKYTRKVFNPGFYRDCYRWREQFEIVEDSRSGRKGIINREGKEVIPPIYDNAYVISMESMPNDWESLLPSYYPKEYSESDAFLLEATSIISEDYCGDSAINCGLFDISGNLIVPVAYESFSFVSKGYIIASDYQGQLYEIYNINGGGKCLISNIDRIYVDKEEERFYLFAAKERRFIDEGTLDVLDYCIPVDFSLTTVLRDSAGEKLQLNHGIPLDKIPEQFRISLGDFEHIIGHYSSGELLSVIYGDSILVKRGEKKCIYYLKTQTESPLYDDLIYQYEANLFLVKVGERSGLLHNGQEILQPIYFGISTVENGFCFIIKENYSLYDVDFINVYDIDNSHTTAFQGLSKEEVLKMIRENYLYFEIKGTEILFNNECPFQMTDEFQNMISNERVHVLKNDWYWGVY